VGKMQVTRDLRILDLYAPLQGVNPFEQGALSYELELREVLSQFSDEAPKKNRRPARLSADSKDSRVGRRSWV
jgi:hypothetical protein